MGSGYSTLFLALVAGAILWRNYLVPVRSIQRVTDSVPDLGALEPDAVAAHLEELLVMIVASISSPEDRPSLSRAIAQAGPEARLATCNAIHDIANRPDFFLVKYVMFLAVFLKFREKWLKISETTEERSMEQQSQPQDYPPLQQ